MLKKFPSDKISDAKIALFFLSRAPTRHSFTFNLRFLYELKHMVRLSKMCVGFYIFNSVSFLLKFIFLFNKTHGLLEKPHKTHRKATYGFAPRLLLFKLQQEVFKSSDIYASWSSPKTELVKKSLNLENRCFENVSFSQ